MNDIEHDIRTGLALLADEMDSTPPPISVITDGTPARRRRVRRPVLIGALAGVVFVGAGAVAASSLLDGPAKKMVDESPCDLDSRDARLVASGVNSAGGTVQYWVIESNDSYGDLITMASPDGQSSPSALGCGALTSDNWRSGNAPYAAAPSTGFDDTTMVDLFGWIPSPAVRAVVSLNNGTSIEVAPTTDGYFLTLFTIPRNDNLRLTGIDAFDANGVLVAHSDL